MEHEPDWKRVEDVALALLSLTLHEGNRVWKQISWDVIDRLHEKGLISNPRTRTQSIALSPEAIERAERVFQELFIPGRTG